MPVGYNKKACKEIEEKFKKLENGQDNTLVSLVNEKIKEIMKQREFIVEAFIAETGCMPSEIEQIEERTESGIKWYLRKRQG